MKKLQSRVGEVYIAILLLIPTILWFISGNNQNLTEGSKLIPRLGELFGLLGLVLFSINIILATRLAFIEKIFVGLNNVYKKHSFLGQLAFVLLLFHPLFLLQRYSFSAKDSIDFLFLSDVWARNFGILSLWLLILLIVLTIFLRPKYHIWKITHQFLGVSLFLGALHAYLIPGYIMNNLVLKLYVLAISVLGILAFLYKTVFGRYLVKKHQYIVKKVTPLNNQVVEVTLAPEEDPLVFNPGQFIFISFKQEGLTESHPFSISSGPKDSNLQVTIKKLGDFTNKLGKELREGTKAEIEGPYGVFTYSKIENTKQVWIAGGIGITPFVSFAKTLIKNPNNNLNIKLFYSVREEPEAVYLELFKDLESKLKGFSVIPFYSSKLGYINADYIKNQVTDFKERDFFICAPPKMIEALRNDLIRKGINKSKIHSEEFNF